MDTPQKPGKYLSFIDVVLFVLLIGGIIWLLVYSSGRIGYNWQWFRVPKYLFTFEDGVFAAGPILDGLWITLAITGYSLILATIIGLITALLRLSGSMIGRFIARAYLEIIRNTPLLVQIFFLYFVLAPIFDIGRFTAAVVALSIFEGAYISEIFRAGIVSIKRGQWEAADSLALSTFATYRFIILPQALKKVLPPFTGQMISLIKDSALVSTIAVYDLTMQGRAIIAETFLTFEVWFTIAAIYLAITLTLSLAVNVLEKNLDRKVRYT